MTDQQHPSDGTETTRTPIVPPPLAPTPHEPYPTIEPGGVAFAGPVGRSDGTSEARTSARRLGILGGSAILLLIGVVAAMAASPAPSVTSGADASSPPDATVAPGASAAPDASAPAGGHDRGPLPAFGLPLGPRGGFGGPGLGFGGFGLGQITITAIDGSDVSLKTDDGWTRTITVTSDTKITKAGKSITVADLAVGDHVRIAEDRASDGTYTVTAIIVVLPSVAGQVSAIDGDTITITQPGGTKATVHVSASTTYQVGGDPGKLSDITVGAFIVAEGSQRSDGSLDAAVVRAGFGGKIAPNGPSSGKPGFPGYRHGGEGASPKPSPAPSTGAS
ncbi:MAG TPA: DUF5666 domain-containing protein [Candidatus Limnocylindrales bacterium]|jgi:hypothetical protein|nr:DUF5666 domain-containing protein [Candidatus Limnocylindrales bacterium]